MPVVTGVTEAYAFSAASKVQIWTLYTQCIPSKLVAGESGRCGLEQSHGV